MKEPGAMKINNFGKKKYKLYTSIVKSKTKNENIKKNEKPMQDKDKNKQKSNKN